MGNSPYRKMWIYGIRKLMLFLFQKKRKSENENPVVAFVHQQVERDSASGSVRVPVAAAQPAAVVAVEPVTPVRVADPGTRPKIVPIRPVATRALPADRAGSSGTPAPTLSIVVATAVDEGVDVTSFRAPDSRASCFDGPTRARRRCRGLRGDFLFPPRLSCRCSGARLCPRRTRRHGIRLPCRSGISGTRPSPDSSRCPRRSKKKFLRPPRSPTALFEGLRRESGTLWIQSPRNPQRRDRRRRRTRRRSLRSPSRRTPAGAPSPKLSAP